MNVLLIYLMVPEDSNCYLLHDVSEEDLNTLDDANGKYINGGQEVDMSSVYKVNDFISDNDEYCINPGMDGNCKWSKFKIENKTGKSLTGPVDRVYMMGFIL